MSGSPLSAICRIDGATSFGTGFLVRASDGELLVLTAGHVADDAPARVTFSPGGVTSAASLVKRGTADWALLRCTDAAAVAALATIDPIALSELEGPPSTPFDTFGYARLYGAGGGPLHGTVRSDASSPFCVELHGKHTDQAQGVSGAPCLVADVAIGVIHSTLGYVGEIVAGTLQVTPATQIVKESAGLLAIDGDKTLPYVRVVSGPLNGVDADNLAAMADALKLPVFAGDQPAPLRRRVARALLVAPPDRVAQAIISVLEVPAVKEAAVRLVVHRESLWVRAATVAAILEIIDHGGAAALDTQQEVTVRHLLRRASWFRGYTERWYNQRSCLMVVPEDASVASVLKAVTKSAYDELKLDAVGFKGRIAKYKVTAVLRDVLPRPEIAKALADEFPELRVIFLSVPDSSAAPLEKPWLLPALQPGEAAWLAECASAREALATGLNRRIDQLDFDHLE